MRLIDAGVVLDNLSGRLESMKDYDAVKDVINNMPTAYDPDKVVEQLYGLKKYGNKYDSYWDSSMYRMQEFENKAINDAVEKAIEIVKGGGVDAKTDS